MTCVNIWQVSDMHAPISDYTHIIIIIIMDKCRSDDTMCICDL